ncbi:F0F1 ATP synthase subunit delta [Flaviflagellibacter deserti]|uniref:ATP synthase subunit delta n=1 Tax=Flaviflagellibacter deserti TaxID=2267266 RepID=A0ABV9Z8I9_9HYPH
MPADDATPTGMAGRYATALYELASEAKAVDTVDADLGRFEALLKDSADLQRLVKSPVFSSEEQLKAISAVLDAAKIGGIAGNLIRLAAQNRRLFAIQGIIRSFRAIVAKARGELTAEVTVAEPLSDARMKDVKDALKEITSKDVKVDVKVDSKIIGGIIVQLGSRMVDASVRTKLSAIQHAMKEVR